MRRTLTLALSIVGIAASLVWLNGPAQAQSILSTEIPFQGGMCGCASTIDGDPVCVEDAPCGALADCDPATPCPAGTACIVNECCHNNPNMGKCGVVGQPACPLDDCTNPGVCGTFMECETDQAPALTQWGLISLAVLLLGAVTLSVVRRRNLSAGATVVLVLALVTAGWAYTSIQGNISTCGGEPDPIAYLVE